ncbi:MAG: HypC/HybG/HupF family hydrogenase formation chaperone [Bacteroidales bacterium]|nr:HypC/HybG/HupF family hydrogenase formation chaperone [Bacteroidota bacterium]
MCLAIPGKIISIDRSNPDLVMAKVDFAGVKKDICIQWVPEAKEGNFILAHVGTALSLIDEKEALETLNLFREMDNLAGDPS